MEQQKAKLEAELAAVQASRADVAQKLAAAQAAASHGAAAERLAVAAKLAEVQAKVASLSAQVKAAEAGDNAIYRSLEALKDRALKAANAFTDALYSATDLLRKKELPREQVLEFFKQNGEGCKIDDLELLSVAGCEEQLRKEAKSKERKAKMALKAAEMPRVEKPAKKARVASAPKKAAAVEEDD